MVYCTDVYKCINILLDSYDDLKKLEEFLGENIKGGKYIEVDKSTFTEYDVSIPSVIGKGVFDFVYNKPIDYIRFYYEY